MKRAEWSLLVLIVAAGFALRLISIDRVPAGMTHDEADVGYHAAAVYETGQRRIVDQPYGFINQPFVQYSGALFMRLFGPTDVAQRLHSIFFGTLLIAVTFAWARRAFDSWIALTAAAFLAAGFWPLMTSRFALNNQPMPVLFGLGVLLLWPALFTSSPPHPLTPPRSRAHFPLPALSGLFLGLSVYPYEAGRAALASVPVLGVYLFSHLARSSTRPQPRAFLIALVVASIVAAPHLLDPRSWGRTGTLVSETVGEGGTASLANAIAEGLGTLFVKGDPFVTYNIPDRPIFDPILAVPFVAGLIVAVRNWRAPAYGYTLIWLAFGLAPTLVVGAFTSTIHSIAAQPPVFILLAIGAVAIARFVARRRALMAATILGALTIYSLTVSVSDYFGRWANDPAVRAAYYNYFASMIDAVNARADARDVALSSAFPDEPLDPFIAARRLRRDDVALRHFDARRAIVFPDADSALLLIPALTPLDPALADRLDLPLPETIALRPDDLIASFDIYAWNPRAAARSFTVTLLAADTPRMQRLASFSQRPPRLCGGKVTCVQSSEPLDVDFGSALRLLAAQVATPEVAPGGEVVVVSLWRVVDPAALGPIDPTRYNREAVLFAHLLDANGAIAAQDDRLDAPAASWRAGDWFAQVHRFILKADAAPGSYRLILGAYTRPSLMPLPASTGGDSVFVGSVEVAP